MTLEEHHMLRWPELTKALDPFLKEKVLLGLNHRHLIENVGDFTLVTLATTGTKQHIQGRRFSLR